MAQYLADLLAGFPGFRGTVRSRNMLGDEEIPMPGREEVTGLGGSGSVRGKGPTDLLSRTSVMRTGAGLGDIYNDAGAGEGLSAYSGDPLPYRKLAPAPSGPMPPLNGRQQVAPLPMAPDVPMVAPAMTAPRSLAGARPPMPQQAAPPQAGVMTPAGATPPERPNFLGRARDWLGGEAFPAGQGMSRGMVLAQMLGNFGAGLSATGRVGTGLQMANQGMWDAREGEQQRAGTDYDREMKRLGLALKYRELEQGPERKPFGSKEQGWWVQGADGTPEQLVPPSQAASRADTPFEVAVEGVPLEQRAEFARRWQEQERSARTAITPYQQQLADIARERLKAEIAKANRPAADRTVGTSEYERLRERLPPDQREAADRKRLQALTTKGESAPFSAGELSGARKDYRSIQKARADIQRYAELYEKHGNQVLPGEAKGEMEAAYGAGLSALAAANNTGVIQPGELPMLQKQLLGPGGFGAEAGELLGVDVAGQVRGQANTMLDRLAKAEQELVSTYGADTLTGAKRDATPPPLLQPGDIVDGYRFKGGDPAEPDNWEPVQ
jgi:hypothetical protein